MPPDSLKRIIKEALFICSLSIVFVLPFSDADAQYRPALLFREDWAETPPATPVTQEHIANEDLILGLYGPGQEGIKKSNHERPVDDPYYVWSGQSEGNWAVTLRHKNANVDLSDHANIVWRSKQSGLRCLYLVVKLANDDWLISDQCDNQSKDWRIHQFNIADIRWYSLDIETIVEGRPVENPDLSEVIEIGFTDLMTGGGTPASSRLDWIEVYGHPVDH